jgi:hypothetical protein
MGVPYSSNVQNKASCAQLYVGEEGASQNNTNLKGFDDPVVSDYLRANFSAEKSKTSAGNPLPTTVESYTS